MKIHSLAILMVLAVIVVVAAVASTAPAAAQTPRIRPVTDAMLADPPPESWLNWRRTRDGWGPVPYRIHTVLTDNGI